MEKGRWGLMLLDLFMKEVGFKFISPPFAHEASKIPNIRNSIILD